MARVLAVAAAGTTLAMALFTASSLLLPGNELLPQRPYLLGVVAYLLAFGAFPCVGGVIAWRRPDHPIGWLFLVIGLTVTVGVFSTEYVYRVLLLDWSLPGAGFVAWVGDWGFQLGMAVTLILVPLLFPDGRPPGPRWNGYLVVVAVVPVVATAAFAFAPGPVPGYDGAFAKPVALPPAAAGLTTLVMELSLPLMVGLGFVSIGSLLIRFRGGGSVERAQVKWFLSACSAFLAVLVVAFVLQADLAFVLAVACLAMIPIATGIAILRYRLFDIDRIVSRTLAWAIVTGLLVGAFGVLVVGLSALLAPVTRESTLAVAVSTLAAAALFQPLRSRVQRAVDRRFNRARYDADRVSAAFTSRLRDEVDLGAISGDLVGTVRGALGPTSAGVWLRAHEEGGR